SGPASIGAASCIQYTVTVLDAGNNPTNVGTNTTVNLSNNLSGIFYSDPACGTSITSVTVNSGSNNAQYWFKDNTAETLTMTASAAGLTAGTLNVAVQPGLATQLVLTGVSSVTAGACVQYTIT